MRPFLTEGNEGFDINQPHDWLAEALVAANSQALPEISKAPDAGAAA
jgi:hypothetical protein